MADEASDPKPAEPTEESKTDDGARIAELSKKSAAYRTARNDALRRAHAYETMLTAHGIDTSPASPDVLKTLPINNGKVDGEFIYTPPKIAVPRVPDAQRAEGKPGLTLEQVRTWHPDEINRRWDEVKGLMEGRT